MFHRNAAYEGAFQYSLLTEGRWRDIFLVVLVSIYFPHRRLIHPAFQAARQIVPTGCWRGNKAKPVSVQSTITPWLLWFILQQLTAQVPTLPFALLIIQSGILTKSNNIPKFCLQFLSTFTHLHVSLIASKRTPSQAENRVVVLNSAFFGLSVMAFY